MAIRWLENTNGCQFFEPSPFCRCAKSHYNPDYFWLIPPDITRKMKIENGDIRQQYSIYIYIHIHIIMIIYIYSYIYIYINTQLLIQVYRLMEQASGIPSRNSKNIFGRDPTSVDLLENAWLSENSRCFSGSP